MRRILSVFLILIAGLATTQPATAQDEKFEVYAGGVHIGHLDATRSGEAISIDYDYKNNGRGPTVSEAIVLDERGYPVAVSITGSTTFGSVIDESFSRDGNTARWRDSGGDGSSEIEGAAFYVAQSGSPWALGRLAHLLLEDEDGAIAILPGGAARLGRHGTIEVAGDTSTANVELLSISGLDLNPTFLALDEQGALFALMSPRFAIVREGFGAAEGMLREKAEELGAKRFADLQARHARNFDGPVRIKNVRIFDPATQTLGERASLVWFRDRIAGIQPLDAPETPGETVIDGEGGTIVPGLYDMHGHISQEDALLNILAGITSVRDTGNTPDRLHSLVDSIERGEFAGPRITPSGFIEGKSDFSSRTGKLVASEKEAVEAVRWYAARGYHQIKIYNSIRPEWIPAMVDEAHRLGMRVSGHVPAFTTADAMIDAGYDEVTHINQLMLQWVLEPGDDPRTLKRFTSLARLGAVDLGSDEVQSTIDAMVANGVTLDATLGAFEGMLLSRTGEVAPGIVPVFEHLPVQAQRASKVAWLKINGPEQGAAYKEGYAQMLRMVDRIRQRGITVVPGTDMGGSFYMHRELELMLKAGYGDAETLAIATLGMAEYLGQNEDLGTVEQGKLADFFLIPGDPTQDLSEIRKIQMVVANGTAYFPDEIYPEFGIKPFATIPEVRSGER